MAIWKPAAVVFVGGHEAVKALKSQKVRTRSPLSGVLLYDPIHHTQKTTDLSSGATGFVTNPHPTLPFILMAFPEPSSVAPASLEALMRQPRFFVVSVGWETFKARFDIETR
jgi:hypothetical protein